MSFTYSHHGQSGKGNYGRHWGMITMNVFDKDKNLVSEVVKGIPIEDTTKPFNIGDYGTADGSATMIFLKDLMVSLREHHGPQLPFQVIYEDLPINDFNSLFRRLSGDIPDIPSYLKDLDNAFPLASGISFRKQCMPTDSMHFIMSSVAVHWLSKVPTKYKDSLYVYPVSSIDEKMKLAEQARTDWELFLLMRSKELKQGGILYLVIPTDFGDGNDDNVKVRKMFDLFTEMLKFFKSTKRITETEFLDTNFGFCLYSMDQLMQPFQKSKTDDFHPGLQVLSIETTLLPNIHYNTWKKRMEDDNIDDTETYARDTTATIRTWSSHIFLSGLSDDRSKDEKVEIIDEMFSWYEKRVKELTPEIFNFDYYFYRLLIRKE